MWGQKSPPPTHTHVNNEKISHPVALVHQNVLHQLRTKINSEVRYITVINYTCLIKKVRAKGKGEDKKVLAGRGGRRRGPRRHARDAEARGPEGRSQAPVTLPQNSGGKWDGSRVRAEHGPLTPQLICSRRAPASPSGPQTRCAPRPLDLSQLRLAPREGVVLACPLSPSLQVSD